MKVLFKNTTQYTKERCNDFNEFHANKYGKKELIKFILMAVCAIYILVFNIIAKNWKVILGFLALILIIYLFNKLKNAKKSKGKRKKAGDKEFTFYFYENHIKVRNRRQTERLSYFELHKIFETDKYFFLYLDEKSSLILSKDGFTIGTAKGFSRFIKNKCPFKYKNQKNVGGK